MAVFQQNLGTAFGTLLPCCIYLRYCLVKMFTLSHASSGEDLQLCEALVLARTREGGLGRVRVQKKGRS